MKTKKYSFPPIETHIHSNNTPPTSPKNSISSKAGTPLIKFDSPFRVSLITKVSTVPFLQKNDNESGRSFVKKIHFERFLTNQKVFTNRARSSSQKKTEASQNSGHFDEETLAKKYKKIRVENQEITIDIWKKYEYLNSLLQKELESKKTVELCFEVIANVFRYIFIEFYALKKKKTEFSRRKTADLGTFKKDPQSKYFRR